MPTIDVNGQLIDFPDSLSPEELNKAVGSAANQINGVNGDKSIVESVSSAIANPTPTRERPKNAAQAVARFAKDTLETMMPPTTIESAKRFLSPQVGQYGVLRSGEDIANYGREDINKLASSFVQKPGVRNFPKIAATIGTGGSLAGDMAIMSPRDVAMGAGIGGLTKRLVAGEMALRRGGAKIGKELISTVFGPTQEAVNARFADSRGMQAAGEKEWVDLASNVTDVVKKATEKLNQKHEIARKTLSKNASLKEGGIGKESLVQGIDDTIKGLGVSEGGPIGPAQESAIGVLRKIKERLINSGEQPPQKITNVVEWDTSGPTPQQINRQVIENGNPLKTGVSENTLKDSIVQLDQNIDWNNPGAGPVNDALEKLRIKWDGILKSKNKAYERAMRPVSAMTRTINESSRILGLVDKPGEGVSPGSNTEAALKNLSGMTRGNARKTLGKLKTITGSDIPAESKLQSLANQFKGGRAQGSRRVNLGSMIGAGIGSLFPGPLRPIGTIVGAGTGGLIGARIDTQGGQMAGTMIDKLASMPPMLRPSTGVGRSLISQLLESSLRRSKENNK